MDDLHEKSIYLRKDNEIIGLHAIGYSGPYTYTFVHLDGTEETKTDDFQQIECWGNEYDKEFNILGKGSFRVFHKINEAASLFESDGWIRFEPVFKEKNK